MGGAAEVIRPLPLMSPCTVRTTAEVVLALLPGWAFDRAHGARTGFMELVAQQLALRR